jgi:PKD repeat protein
MFLAGLAVLALGCLFAPVALAQDPPDFTVDPTPPIAGNEATFTPNPSNVPAGATVSWDYEADGTFVPEDPGTHTFLKAGSYTVTMRVDDAGTVIPYTETVVVGPIADFHRGPGGSAVLATGEEATFISDSVASGSSTLSWDFDGDGDFDDAFGPSVTHSFATSGNQVVQLLVEEPNGESDIAISTFRVNAPPVAGFVWSPGSPVAGGEVQLFSTSVDAEGPVSEAWDLDGDGEFDDALGSSATASFSAGEHLVSLLVTDRDGVPRTVTRTITVAAPVIVPSTPPPAPTPTPAPAKPAFMNPFPTVRLVGIVVPGGARITLVEVRGAPRGARVTVRCTGKGCPFRSRRRIAETGRVRLSAFARVLAAGARIEVFVRAPNVIGRYVSFRIRAGKRPVRTDRCLMPGATEPTRCT